MTFQSLMGMTPRGINVLTERMLEIHMDEEKIANPNKTTEMNKTP